MGGLIAGVVNRVPNDELLSEMCGVSRGDAMDGERREGVAWRLVRGRNTFSLVPTPHCRSLLGLAASTFGPKFNVPYTINTNIPPEQPRQQ